MFIILFALVAKTSNSTADDLWFGALVVIGTLIELTLSTVFWKFDFWIQPILEGVFICWITVWLSIGWDSFRRSGQLNSTEVQAAGFALGTSGLFLILWIISYIMRTINYAYKFKEIMQGKKIAKEHEDSTNTNQTNTFMYGMSYFFPKFSNDIDLDAIDVETPLIKKHPTGPKPDITEKPHVPSKLKTSKISLNTTAGPPLHSSAPVHPHKNTNSSTTTHSESTTHHPSDKESKTQTGK